MILAEPTVAHLADGITDDLIDRFCEHLRNEESALTAMVDSVRSLHHSLRHLSSGELGKSLEAEAVALEAAKAVQSSRNQLQTEMADALGLPRERLTLTTMAENASGRFRDSIVTARDRLFVLSTELNVLNRQNAAMIQQSLMLIRGIVGQLTKTAGIGESYNAGGIKEEAHVGSLVQWGG